MGGVYVAGTGKSISYSTTLGITPPLATMGPASAQFVVKVLALPRLKAQAGIKNEPAGSATGATSAGGSPRAGSETSHFVDPPTHNERVSMIQTARLRCGAAYEWLLIDFSPGSTKS